MEPINEISYEYFTESLWCNCEIEFILNGHLFFASPTTNPPAERNYSVFDTLTREFVFSGNIEELLNFRFDGSNCLRLNYDMFDIVFIY